MMFRRTIHILVIGFIPCLMLVMANCTQMTAEEKKATHYERGMAYFDEGKYQEAVIEFKNVIQIDPKDANGHYQLALSHLKIGGITDMQLAYGELTKTVDLDPSNQDAQLKLGELFLLGRKPAEARERAEIVLASSPQDPKGHLLRGRSLISEKEYTEGISELKKSIELDPDNIQIYLDLARAYVGLKDFPIAEQTLKDALAKHPDSTQLVTALGDFYAIQQKTEEAEAQYRKAIALDPDNEGLYVKLALFFQAYQKFDQAETTYQQLVAEKPGSEKPHLFLGDFYTFMGQMDKALESFQQALEVNPDSTAARERLTNHYIDTGKFELARELVNVTLDKDKHDLMGRVHKARLRLARGEVDRAISLLQEVLTDKPNLAAAHEYLGIAHGARKEFSQAATELSEAVKLAPNNVTARTALAAVRLASGDFNSAIKEAKTGIRLNPRNLKAVRILGSAYLQKGEIAKAKKVFEMIVEQVPQEASSHYQLGLIARNDKRWVEAIGHFEQSLKNNRDSLQALTQLSNIHLVKGDAKAARDRVLEQIEVSPQNPLFYNLLGRLWMQAKDVAQAEIAFKKAIELDESVQASYLNLAELYRLTNRTEEAVREYEQLVKRNPKLVSAHMVLGMIAEQQADYEKAKTHYQSTLDIQPKFAPAANNLAWILAEHGGNLDVALSHAQVAREQQPQEPHIADTLGWIYYKKDAYLKSVSLLGEAAEKLKDNPVVQYHFGMAQYKKGNTVEAKKALEAALKLNANFPGADEAKTTLNSL